MQSENWVVKVKLPDESWIIFDTYYSELAATVNVMMLEDMFPEWEVKINPPGV